MHTEDEAGKMKCPISKVRHAITMQLMTGATNGNINEMKELIEASGNAQYCDASDCPMWRWNKDSGYMHADESESAPTKGYCGLAGKP